MDEPIFPIAKGKVISIRTDGPYAQVIIKHKPNDYGTVWSVYEHIAGIQVTLGDEVDPFTPIARFMNLKELNTNGWQFDHVHLEILRVAPYRRQPTNYNPDLLYGTYWNTCYTWEELLEKYYNPLEFLDHNWRRNHLISY